MPVKLSWIFPGAPLNMGAPGNIQGNLTCMINEKYWLHIVSLHRMYGYIPRILSKCIFFHSCCIKAILNIVILDLTDSHRQQKKEKGNKTNNKNSQQTKENFHVNMHLLTSWPTMIFFIWQLLYPSFCRKAMDGSHVCWGNIKIQRKTVFKVVIRDASLEGHPTVCLYLETNIYC